MEMFGDLLQQLLAVLIPLLVAALTWVAKLAGDYFSSKIIESRNTIDNSAAVVAVRWVEDFMQSESGQAKFVAAVDRTLKMVNKKKKYLDQDDAERMVRAAYTAFIKPMKKIKN